MVNQSNQNYWLAIVSMVGLIILLVIIVSHFWKFVVPEEPVAEKETGQVMQQEPVDTLDLQTIDWQLFGHYIADVASVEQLPETTLQLELMGVFAAGDENFSRAIIAAPGHVVGEKYGPGDTVPGGAVIERILTRSIVLNRGGQLEVLSLPEYPLEFSDTLMPSGLLYGLES